MNWVVTYGPGGFGEALNKPQESNKGGSDESWNPFSGKPGPQICAPKKPPLSMENQVVYRYYGYLCTHKVSGMGEGPIPLNAITQYAKERLRFDDRQTDIFERRIMAFDNAMMTARRKQREASKPSKGE